MLDFVVGQPIRLLPCMHYYHMRCIDDWLMRSLTCPTCMERVDVGVRKTVLSSHQTLRRRRVGSSSSTISTISSTSSSSVDQTPNYGHTSPSPSSSSGGGCLGGFGHQHGPQLQRQWNQNGIRQQSHSHSPVHSRSNQLTLNLDQVNARNINSITTVVGEVSPPGSPLQNLAGGRTNVPQRAPPSPPIIEYHYEYLTTPTISTTTGH